MNAIPQPGSAVEVRSATWKVLQTRQFGGGYREVRCRCLSGIARGKEARFVWDLESDPQVIDPKAVELVPDASSGLIDTKLHLEAAFRNAPTTSRKPLAFGKAAIDDLPFQRLPAERALAQDRVRLLIADDVGLGKTLQAGLVASELALRGRARRILVVATRAMLGQFQKEFWTRFAIPLCRLDGQAIRRMRNRIPAHFNVFDQFDRSIVSIDTLKKDSQIRAAIRDSRWDLAIIDEAHNAAKRKSATGTNSQRARLANLLSRSADSLLLLTATPHDGSQESFASLIEMLDPTRVPDPSKLVRGDIEDLVVRRFRSSPEVARDLGSAVPDRKLSERKFELSKEEEIAYQSIAELELDIDEEMKSGRAIDLFRTTIAKAIFSSPAACIETLDRRIKGIEKEKARGTAKDQASLEALRDQVAAIGTGEFSKYQDLIQHLREIGWNGGDPRDRLVIFTERLATVTWLAKRLQDDLGLGEERVARVDGSGVEAEARTLKTLEEFGQEQSPIRILIASDLASEGLNLHFQCHRLVHFDLPWSLLRFQQRNGRIDRYGQDRQPQIAYFIAKPTHPKVRQMWVLDKLVERDKVARKGIGDPAVFLGAGDAEGEEIVVAEAVASGNGPEKFSAEMDERADKAAAGKSVDEEYDALFGGYVATVTDAREESGDAGETLPPRLYEDAFSYASAMIDRMWQSDDRIFDTEPSVSAKERMIRMKIPRDMRARDVFGYASEGAVDGRYMPEEAVGPGDQIELTDQSGAIKRAIDEAKMLERSWPTVQYLWDGHPILEWFGDQASAFFPERAAPAASLAGRLEPGEIVAILHGAIPNEKGAPVVDRWAAIVCKPDENAFRIEEVGEFLQRTRLSENVPNRQLDDLEPAKRAIPRAVDKFQTHLVELRRAREAEIEHDIDSVLGRLSGLEKRFKDRLTLDLDEPSAEKRKSDPVTNKRRALRRRKEEEVDHLFEEWTEWFEKTRRMADDPNPYVEVVAVFAG